VRRAAGFTLLEVMVALAIVSIGLIAAFNGVIQMAHSTTTLRERAFADWIAMNQITEIRVGGEFPDVGRFDGDVEFAGRDWRWEAEIQETGLEGLRRVDVAVAYIESPDQPVTLMTGFISRDSGGLPPVNWWGEQAPPQGDAPGEEDQPQDAETPEPAPAPPEEDDE
jgi:general secretion pathway protein I